MQAGRPRGRPRRAEPIDAAIARTVWQLCCWGYPLRSRGRRAGICEIVGQQARTTLRQKDRSRPNLGPDRVEQIYEEWLASARYVSGWSTKGRRVELPFGRPWSQVTVRHLRMTGPQNLPLALIAERLLRNAGIWTGHLPRLVGDREPTAKGWEAIEGTPRLAEKNGVEK